MEAAGASWSSNLPPAALGAAEVVEDVAAGRDASEPWSSLGVGVSKGQGEEIFRASQAPSVPGDAHAPAAMQRRGMRRHVLQEVPVRGRNNQPVHIDTKES